MVTAKEIDLSANIVECSISRVTETNQARITAKYEAGYTVVVLIPNSLVEDYAKKELDLMDEGQAMEFAEEWGADYAESRNESMD